MRILEHESSCLRAAEFTHAGVDFDVAAQEVDVCVGVFLDEVTIPDQALISYLHTVILSHFLKNLKIFNEFCKYKNH